MKFKLRQDLPIYRHALTFALKRLATKRWLALSLVLGMLVSAALATAIPVYSDGINASILWDSLAKGAGHRQAFDFVFRYVGSWNGAVDEDQYQPVNQYLSEQASSRIGLSQLEQTRYLAHILPAALSGGGGFCHPESPRPGQAGLSHGRFRAYPTDRRHHARICGGTRAGGSLGRAGPCQRAGLESRGYLHVITCRITAMAWFTGRTFSSVGCGSQMTRRAIFGRSIRLNPLKRNFWSRKRAGGPPQRICCGRWMRPPGASLSMGPR